MSRPNGQLAIDVQGVHKSYRLGRVTLKVLRGVSLQVERGRFVAVVGASGSGKSTLLHLAGVLDRQDSGTIKINGVDMQSVGAAGRNRIRCRDIGFVFQFYHLMGELNVLENVMLPAMVDSSALGWLHKRRGAKAARARAMDLLEKLGLDDRLKHRPRELSGGERQRVAIARALINDPDVLLADEPTGNLDSKTGRQIMRLLKSFNDAGQTIVMVTHDASLVKECDRVEHLRDGRLNA